MNTDGTYSYYAPSQGNESYQTGTAMETSSFSQSENVTGRPYNGPYNGPPQPTAAGTSNEWAAPQSGGFPHTNFQSNLQGGGLPSSFPDGNYDSGFGMPQQGYWATGDSTQYATNNFSGYQQGEDTSGYQQGGSTYDYSQWGNNYQQEGTAESGYQQGGSNSGYQQGDNSGYQPGGNNFGYQQGGSNSGYQQGGNNFGYQQGGNNSGYQQDGSNSGFQKGGNFSGYKQGGDNCEYQQEGNKLNYNPGRGGSSYHQGKSDSGFQQGDDGSGFKQGSDWSYSGRGRGAYQRGRGNSSFQQRGGGAGRASSSRGAVGNSGFQQGPGRKSDWAGRGGSKAAAVGGGRGAAHQSSNPPKQQTNTVKMDEFYSSIEAAPEAKQTRWGQRKKQSDGDSGSKGTQVEKAKTPSQPAKTPVTRAVSPPPGIPEFESNLSKELLDEDTDYCKLCNIYFTSGPLYALHIRGLSHVQRVMAAEQQLNTNPAITPFIVTGKTYSQANSHENGLSSQNSTEPEGRHCKVCDATLSSQQSWWSHKVSTSHRQALKNGQYKNLGVNPLEMSEQDFVEDSSSFDSYFKSIAPPNQPIVGLDYMVETVLGDERCVVCELCDVRGAPRNMVFHVLGLKHRSNFMKSSDFVVWKTSVEKKKKSDKVAALHEACKTAERKMGRGVPRYWGPPKDAPVKDKEEDVKVYDLERRLAIEALKHTLLDQFQKRHFDSELCQDLLKVRLSLLDEYEQRGIDFEVARQRVIEDEERSNLLLEFERQVMPLEEADARIDRRLQQMKRYQQDGIPAEEARTAVLDKNVMEDFTVEFMSLGLDRAEAGKMAERRLWMLERLHLAGLLPEEASQRVILLEMEVKNSVAQRGRNPPPNPENPQAAWLSALIETEKFVGDTFTQLQLPPNNATRYTRLVLEALNALRAKEVSPQEAKFKVMVNLPIPDVNEAAFVKLFMEEAAKTEEGRSDRRRREEDRDKDRKPREERRDRGRAEEDRDRDRKRREDRDRGRAEEDRDRDRKRREEDRDRRRREEHRDRKEKSGEGERRERKEGPGSDADLKERVERFTSLLDLSTPAHQLMSRYEQHFQVEMKKLLADMHQAKVAPEEARAIMKTFYRKIESLRMNSLPPRNTANESTPSSSEGLEKSVTETSSEKNNKSQSAKEDADEAASSEIKTDEATKMAEETQTVEGQSTADNTTSMMETDEAAGAEEGKVSMEIESGGGEANTAQRPDPAEPSQETASQQPEAGEIQEKEQSNETTKEQPDTTKVAESPSKADEEKKTSEPITDRWQLSCQMLLQQFDLKEDYFQRQVKKDETSRKPSSRDGRPTTGSRRSPESERRQDSRRSRSPIGSRRYKKPRWPRHPHRSPSPGAHRSRLRSIEKELERTEAMFRSYSPRRRSSHHHSPSRPGRSRGSRISPKRSPPRSYPPPSRRPRLHSPRRSPPPHRSSRGGHRSDRRGSPAVEADDDVRILEEAEDAYTDW